MTRARMLAIFVATACDRSAPAPTLAEPAQSPAPAPTTTPAPPSAPPIPLAQAGLPAETIWVRVSRARIDASGGWRIDLVDGKMPKGDADLTGALTRLREQAAAPHRDRIALFVTRDIVFETLVTVLSAAKSAGFSNHATYAIRDDGSLEPSGPPAP